GRRGGGAVGPDPADFPYDGSANLGSPISWSPMPTPVEPAQSPVTSAGSSQVALFEVRNLHVSVQGTEILRGVDLVVPAGELHALMGPNGSGKSTLARSLLGSPGYVVTEGQVLYKGEDITAWPTETRGKAGIFLAFQYPEEIAGVPLVQFLRQALSARKGVELSVLELRFAVMEWMAKLGMDASFGDRYLNDGFSGGEKKRNEVLQMAVLQPDLAILDETDSGLDIDALKVVANGVKEVRSARPRLGVLLITHYQRILEHLSPDAVHLLVNGRIVQSGGPELALALEREGYEPWR
ncbi:MAG: Fe-S cluster assembly ATPase SufC, partial [Acidimicrobiales bacterium]